LIKCIPTTRSASERKETETEKIFFFSKTEGDFSFPMTSKIMKSKQKKKKISFELEQRSFFLILLMDSFSQKIYQFHDYLKAVLLRNK
jgi:hypothetical protein